MRWLPGQRHRLLPPPLLLVQPIGRVAAQGAAAAAADHSCSWVLSCAAQPTTTPLAGAAHCPSLAACQCCGTPAPRPAPASPAHCPSGLPPGTSTAMLLPLSRICSRWVSCRGERRMGTAKEGWSGGETAGKKRRRHSSWQQACQHRVKTVLPRWHAMLAKHAPRPRRLQRQRNNQRQRQGQHNQRQRRWQGQQDGSVPTAPSFPLA